LGEQFCTLNAEHGGCAMTNVSLRSCAGQSLSWIHEVQVRKVGLLNVDAEAAVLVRSDDVGLRPV
jgi:hypothetical protein